MVELGSKVWEMCSRVVEKKESIILLCFPFSVVDRTREELVQQEKWKRNFKLI